MLGLAPQNLNRAAIKSEEQTTNESAFSYPVGTVQGLYRVIYEGRTFWNGSSYDFASAIVNETSTDGTNTDTRTLDYSSDYPDGLAELPDNTKDDSGTKRVSNWYELMSGDIAVIGTAPVNVDVVGIPLTVFENSSPQTGAIDGGFIVTTSDGALEEVSAGDRDNVQNIGKFYTDTTTFYFIVANGEFANVSEAEAFYVGSTEFRYKLATPIQITTPQKPLATFENGSYSATVPIGLHPTKKYTTPKSIGATYTDFLDYVIQLNAWLP